MTSFLALVRHPGHQVDIASGIWHYILQPYHAALIVGGASVLALIAMAARRRLAIRRPSR